MQVRCVSAAELTTEDLSAWSSFQQADAALASPFFRPEFTQTVAAIRDDVRVGILEADGERVGFFPFHLLPGNIGIPVGGPMSGAHGAIARRGLVWDAPALLAGCGLVAWRFDHLVASQTPFAGYHCIRAGSPYIDLSAGFDAYYDSLHAKGSPWFRDLLRKSRQVQRQIGPLRMELHTANADVFETLWQWKHQQIHGSRPANGEPMPWTWQVAQRALEQPSEGFSAVLSALRFGEQLAAVQFGFRSRNLMQGWILAYNPAFAKYSPGMMLLLETAKAAQTAGIRQIDLGRGTQMFKRRFMTGETAMAEGTVDLRLLRGTLWRVWLRTHNWVRHSRFQAAAYRLNRALGDPCSRFGLRACATYHGN